MPYPRIDTADVAQDRGSYDYYPLSKSTASKSRYNRNRAITLGATCNEAQFTFSQGTANINEVIKCIPFQILSVSLSVVRLTSGVTYAGDTIAVVSEAEAKEAIDQLWADIIAP